MERVHVALQNTWVLEFYKSAAETLSRLGTTASLLLFVGFTFLGTALAVVAVVMLPADHFRTRIGGPFHGRHPALRALLLGCKNLLGLICLPLGIFMALPLVPGPGLVFILIGLSLIDFPGKKALELRLLRRPGVHRFIDDLRAQFKRPPLQLD